MREALAGANDSDTISETGFATLTGADGPIVDGGTATITDLNATEGHKLYRIRITWQE